MMDWTKHVVKVGDGRGFVVDGPKTIEHQRYVITAAHCLPVVPPANRESDTVHRMHFVLGTLGGKNKIFTECFFFDHISDVAVLGRPTDEANFPAELGAYAYDNLVNSIPPAPIGELTDEDEVFVLQLNGQWTSGQGEPGVWSGLYLTEVSEGIHGGMSGSPIMNRGGEAVGVLTSSGGGMEGIHTEGNCASLARSLPVWFFSAVSGI